MTGKDGLPEHGQRENMEEMIALARGPKGDKGEPGAALAAVERRAVVYLAILTVLLAATGLFTALREVGSLRSAITASCKFDADLGGAPIATLPHMKASLLGVTIVADARVAWRHLGCPGSLAPPAPSFLHWARYYHLPDPY